jgi:hypothetical protein
MRFSRHANLVKRGAALLLCGLFISGCAGDDADWGLQGQGYGGSERHKIKVAHGKAVVPKCGDWSGDLANSSSLAMNPNHGCALQANMAAMISDPRDLTQKPKLGKRSSTLDIDAIKSSQTRKTGDSLFELFFGL